MYYDNFCKSLSGWPTAKLLRIPLNPTLAKHSGIKCSISTMYRGAVPITEHQPADVLEPLRGMGWRGHPDPTMARSSGRFALPGAPCHCGAGGYAKPLRGSCYIHLRGRDGGIPAPVLLPNLLFPCESLARRADHLRQNLLNLREIVPTRMAIVKQSFKSCSSPIHSAKIC